LVNAGFDAISVKQVSTIRRSPVERTITINFPLFLINLPRKSKPHEIFKLTRVCRISIRADMSKAQTGLTQCYNCQKFGHVWANCNPPPLCMWRREWAVTCTRSAQKRATQHRSRLAATASCWTKRNLIPPAIEAAGTPRKRCGTESRRECQDYNGKGVLFQPQ
jgi:hypothetical protein